MPQHHADGRRLAGPVGAEEGEALTAAHPHAQVGDSNSAFFFVAFRKERLAQVEQAHRVAGGGHRRGLHLLALAPDILVLDVLSRNAFFGDTFPSAATGQRARDLVDNAHDGHEIVLHLPRFLDHQNGPEEERFHQHQQQRQACSIDVQLLFQAPLAHRGGHAAEAEYVDAERLAHDDGAQPEGQRGGRGQNGGEDADRLQVARREAHVQRRQDDFRHIHEEEAQHQEHREHGARRFGGRGAPLARLIREEGADHIAEGVSHEQVRNDENKGLRTSEHRPRSGEKHHGWDHVKQDGLGEIVAKPAAPILAHANAHQDLEMPQARRLLRHDLEHGVAGHVHQGQDKEHRRHR
mmetsp:Transcript_10443/g.30986  ORF Transcript_10443/g.30986 Transcript_10443/m.30986 type:complete len:351 (-) Transcript_10443:491-1543(-)